MEKWKRSHVFVYMAKDVRIYLFVQHIVIASQFHKKKNTNHSGFLKAV